LNKVEAQPPILQQVTYRIIKAASLAY